MLAKVLALVERLEAARTLPSTGSMGSLPGACTSPGHAPTISESQYFTVEVNRYFNRHARKAIAADALTQIIGQNKKRKIEAGDSYNDQIPRGALAVAVQFLTSLRGSTIDPNLVKPQHGVRFFEFFMFKSFSFLFNVVCLVVE